MWVLVIKTFLSLIDRYEIRVRIFLTTLREFRELRVSPHQKEKVFI